MRADEHRIYRILAAMQPHLLRQRKTVVQTLAQESGRFASAFTGTVDHAHQSPPKYSAISRTLTARASA